MPLHDWTNDAGWEGVYFLWIAELVRWIKPRLPEGYRAFVGSTPRLTIGRPAARPDLSIREYPRVSHPSGRLAEDLGGRHERSPPDLETTTLALQEEVAIFVESDGWLVSAIEIVSPRNKDRPDSRDSATGRYLGYLRDGAHLLLIDVLPRPYGFSFADRFAEALGVDQPGTPPPFAVSYRVGEPTPEGGRFLAIWKRPMTVGEPLPTIALPLTVHQEVLIDLEATYSGAARDAYLD